VERGLERDHAVNLVNTSFIDVVANLKPFVVQAEFVASCATVIAVRAGPGGIPV